jgi:hypothetical protein
MVQLAGEPREHRAARAPIETIGREVIPVVADM